MIDSQTLYNQYLFLRRECKKGFSDAIWQLSLSHNRHEQVIIKLLIEQEDKLNG